MLVKFRDWSIPSQVYEVILEEVLRECDYSRPFPQKWESKEQGLEFVLRNEVSQGSRGEWFWIKDNSLCFLFSESKRVEVPDFVEKLGVGSYFNTTNSCFFQASRLETIKLPKRINQIGKYTFSEVKEECIIECKPFALPFLMVKESLRVLREEGQVTLGELFGQLLPEASVGWSDGLMVDKVEDISLF